MVGGTTSAVQAMILLSTCKAGDKIILPRNVHKSALNALVLLWGSSGLCESGDECETWISLGMEIDRVARAIEDNPDAKAVLVNNPTYYGICSDLRAIVKLAHSRGIKVLTDEAHGTHLVFWGKPSGMWYGSRRRHVCHLHAQIRGSLTQSSILLTGKEVKADHVRQIINLTQTTSASYLLLSSLDISRKEILRCGEENLLPELQKWQNMPEMKSILLAVTMPMDVIW